MKRMHVLRYPEPDDAGGGDGAKDTKPQEGAQEPDDGNKGDESKDNDKPAEDNAEGSQDADGKTEGEGSDKDADKNGEKKDDEPYSLSFSDSFEQNEQFTSIVTPVFEKAGIDGKLGGSLIEQTILALNEFEQKQREQDDADLKEDWGADYQANKAAAQAARKQLIAMDSRLSEDDMNVFSSAKGMRILFALGEHLNGKGATDTTARGSANDKAWAHEVMHNPAHPDFHALHNSSDPRFSEVNDRYNAAMGY